MKIGIMSDTHRDKDNALSYIVQKGFLRLGVEHVIHCGDIEWEHVRSDLFGGLRVTCALTDEQIDESGGDPGKLCPNGIPDNWEFTIPGDRIRKIGDIYAYIGHKRSFEFLFKSENELLKVFDEIRTNHNNVRYVFSGHTHHQIMLGSPLITFINPGAVESALGAAGGYEFAILDTESESITFNRIRYPVPVKKQLKVGIISDSFDVAEMNPPFWDKLAEKFKEENVTHVIHCGNISLQDIGKILPGFNVYCNLRSDQEFKGEKPANWELFSEENPIVDIYGYKFCIQLNVGQELVKENEIQMQDRSMGILLRYPEIKFLLCGHTRNAFFEEGQGLVILNPGDVIGDGSYAILSLPYYKITFSRIHRDPLPPLDEVLLK